MLYLLAKWFKRILFYFFMVFYFPFTQMICFNWNFAHDKLLIHCVYFTFVIQQYLIVLLNSLFIIISGCYSHIWNSFKLILTLFVNKIYMNNLSFCLHNLENFVLTWPVYKSAFSLGDVINKRELLGFHDSELLYHHSIKWQLSQ